MFWETKHFLFNSSTSHSSKWEGKQTIVFVKTVESVGDIVSSALRHHVE